MIDTIRLHLPQNGVQDLTAKLQDYRRRDTNTGSGHIGFMKVFHNLDGVTICGSLPKYLRGENITPRCRNDVKTAIEKLESETGLDLTAAVVGSVEVGTSIILRNKPADYLRLFGDPPIYIKSVYSKAGILETVAYGTPTGAFQFCAYDKIREMKDKRQDIPTFFAGYNVLRLEYRIIRRRGIKAKFGRDLTAHDLFDYAVYRELQGLFIKAYQTIPKTGRVVFVDKSKPVTPARLETLQAVQWRQSCPDEYNAFVQSLKENGALSEKNHERIRAKDRKQSRDFSMSDKNPLIEELDAFIVLLRDNC